MHDLLSGFLSVRVPPTAPSKTSLAKPAIASTRTLPIHEPAALSTRHGCTTPLGTVSANAPHFPQVLLTSSPVNATTAALTCVPRSVQWNALSCTTSRQAWQYQRRRSRLRSGRGCSSTIPTVEEKRMGLCGVLGGRRNISPSRMGTSRKVGSGPVESSTTLSSMLPRYW